MEMNIQKYLSFVKTVEYGSFTKAAEMLNYTQSGIILIFNQSVEKNRRKNHICKLLLDFLYTLSLKISITFR